MTGVTRREAGLLTLPVRVLAVAAMASLPWALLPALFAAADSGGQPLVWWASRSLGFVAYVAMWLSMLFGTLVGARGIDGLLPRKLIMDLHQQWTLAAVIAAVLHVVTIVGHEVESGVAPIAAFVPFAAQNLTGAVALGTVALWGLAVVALSSWLRSRIPFGWWRGLHSLAFGAFLLALMHGILAGTDTGLPVVQWMYIVTGALFSGTLTARLVVAMGRTRHPARASRGEGSRAA